MVLPLVPVTPQRASRSPGRPCRLAAAMASARRAEGTSSTGAGGQSRARSASTATAPERAAAGAKAAPSARVPGDGHEERAGFHFP